MIEVRTFISKNNIWFNEKLSKSEFDRQYINFEDKEKELEIKLALRYLNDYIDFSPMGFIKIKLNGQELIGEEEFDYLNELWNTYILLITSYLIKGSGREYLDYSHKKITLETYDDTNILLQITFVPEEETENLSINIDKEFILPENEFILALLRGAYNYYERLYSYGDNEKLIIKMKELSKLYNDYTGKDI
ncbi:hypothetical protein [Evansella clarkii]|jgi:hypothetical protein|uniref:hypothetical protein n=1 Tax=Evansella clarkii TaxID=79879 RepID=UPI000997265D|nr:hypothetical protein [Evansella clarkii]